MRLSTNRIKCAALAIAALALTLGGMGQAKAAFIPSGGTPATGETGLGGGGPAGPDPIFVLTFSDASGDVGQATLNTVASGLRDGSYFATSGSLTMTSPAGVAGTYSLITTPPSPTISPSGLFDVDNLLYPDDNAAAGTYNPVASNYAGGSPISGPSYLDIFGLLFGNPGTEINIYGVGNGAYAFYTEVNGGYNIQQGGGGVVSNLTDPPAVPEPASLTLFIAGGVALLGYAGLRRRRFVPHRA